MFKIPKNVALDVEIDQGRPIGRSHQSVDRRVSLGRSLLILNWIDKIDYLKRAFSINIPEST